ncbi:cell wall hydrolase [Halarsenatibacter silvermanii]|uniref:Cell Wall Hydrolase n=1 Tax=Halarsenatibacter silvermanii TaxID=321763 RepID=A0A1G9P0X4_9FIRM|nr:cell wall hydrolase [Halarsenatibacter silvermanii]SDL91855.1 Cell Wall Hydrolase [Halarsenatibacter silvermanii]
MDDKSLIERQSDKNNYKINNYKIKTKIITIIILIVFFIISTSGIFLLPDLNNNNTVHASDFDGEDVLKGVGVAVLILTATQYFFGSDEKEDEDIEDPHRDDEEIYRVDREDDREIVSEEAPMDLIYDDDRRSEIRSTMRDKSIDESDINKLAQLVHGEARGEPFIGQIAVAAVVLNRLEAANFPDSIPDIIYQSEQFTAVTDGQYFQDPETLAYLAVFEALEGNDPSQGARYFYNPKTADNLDWFRTLEKTAEIGNHVFAIK